MARLHHVAAGMLLACALALPWPAAAQGPLLPLPAKPAASNAQSQASVEALDKQRSELPDEVARVRALYNRLVADPTAAGAPESLAPEDLAAARNTLSQWVTLLEAQQRAIDEQRDALAEWRAADQASRDWTGFAEPPPYSILQVDSLHESIDAMRTRIGAFEAQRAIAVAESERARDDAQRRDAALRRIREAATMAPSDQARLAGWETQQAEWAASAAATQVALFQRRLETVDASLAAQRARLELAQRQLGIASREVRFSDDDLEQVRRQQHLRIASLRAEQARAVGNRDRAERQLASAAQALRRAEAEPQSPGLPAARAQLRAAQAASDAARLEVLTLDHLAALAAASVDLYTQRFHAMNDHDAAQRREALLRLREVSARVRPWRDFAQTQLDLTRIEERSRLVSADRLDQTSQVRAHEEAIGEAIARRAASAQLLFDAADHAARTASRWLVEIETAQQARPVGDRLAGAWATARDWSQRIWDFELFAVEDTVEVAGQRITTSRGVTVGKSIGAVLLFIVGYWLASLLAQRFERLLIERFGVESAQARTVRRWVLALWAFVLLMLTLNLARIPLTVFAFLGGALAIGVGFGTQTIIRNVISGLIVLMERQVRVGDTIEVDGVTGTVTEVNLRSSTVRGFDGVESMIPNASLLENKVTNWTRTDKRVRRVVRVGVAYGSPVRQVADLLLDCLQRHGLVLKEPTPLVLFEDFGDNALVFGMYFWLEMRPGVVSTAVMSDLRFMVHKALEEAGIGVPFPQRDVHLDTSRPLQVELRSPPA